MSIRVQLSWFNRFQFGDYHVKDAARSDPSHTDENDSIFEKMEKGRHINTIESTKIED